MDTIHDLKAKAHDALWRTAAFMRPADMDSGMARRAMLVVAESMDILSANTPLTVPLPIELHDLAQDAFSGLLTAAGQVVDALNHLDKAQADAQHQGLDAWHAIAEVAQALAEGFPAEFRDAVEQNGGSWLGNLGGRRYALEMVEAGNGPASAS